MVSTATRPAGNRRKGGGEVVLIECIEKANVLIEAGPFASHWMVECIAFAKANQVQTFF